MSHYPDDFRGTLPGERQLRGDDADRAEELNEAWPHLDAIRTAREAYLSALKAQQKYLHPTGKRMLAEYLQNEGDIFQDSCLGDEMAEADQVED